jgi:heme-degrading monooxygenase HmoA
MIYEFRSYEAAPGRIDDLDDRFRDLTIAITERLGFRQAGYWRVEDPDRLVYLLVWTDREQAKAAWAEFAADPEWQAGKAASEANGPLLKNITTEWWTPTSYSALR